MRPFLYLLPFCLATAAVPTNPTDDDDDNCAEWDGDIIENKDGPTKDGSPGLGIEFETPWFYFTSPKCSEEDVNRAKKKLVGGRQQKGDNPLWMLTADTGAGERKLQAEYILDGQQIKLGSGKAEEVAKEIVEDFGKWEPWKERKGTDRVKIDVKDIPCDFYIDAPHPNTDAKKISFDPQITAPLPLEAMYVLIKERASHQFLPDKNEYYNLIGESSRNPGTQRLVTKLFLRDKPNDIDSKSITDDTLAFLSLVLTYAKTIAQNPLKKDESVKLRSVFMPRSDFHTLYKQVKSQLPGDLWTIIDTISCYKAPTPKTKNENVDVAKIVLDKDFCSKGENGKGPVRGKKLGEAKFGDTTVKKWIESLDSKDLLTEFDKEIDGSVGGLGSKMEKALGTDREVPLFEFRDLKDQTITDMAEFVKDVDEKLKKLHQDHKKAPGKED